jgi:type II secretory pathway component PulF
MICPHCKKEVPEGPECIACGIVFAKYKPRIDSQATTNQPREMEAEKPWPFRPFSDGKLASLYYQMARMLDSGLPLGEMLRMVARNSSGRQARSFEKMLAQVESGASLSMAMQVDPALFPARVRNLVSVGEQSGGLPATFIGLAQSCELRLDMQRRIIIASLYPFFLLTFFFFTLPLSKLISSGLGAYLQASLLPYLYTLGIIGFILVGIPWFLRLVVGKVLLERFYKAIPLIGKLFVYRAVLRFAQNLATCLGAGIELYTSLDLASKASGDLHLAEQVNQGIVPAVQKGQTLETAFSITRLFDQEFVLALSSGEISGRLQEALEQQARRLQETLIHRLTILVWALGMVMLVAVATVIVSSVVNEYQNIFGTFEKVLEQATGGQGSGLDQLFRDLPPELKEIINP